LGIEPIIYRVDSGRSSNRVILEVITERLWVQKIEVPQDIAGTAVLINSAKLTDEF
jgi:hypothetical protein